MVAVTLAALAVVKAMPEPFPEANPEALADPDPHWGYRRRFGYGGFGGYGGGFGGYGGGFGGFGGFGGYRRFGHGFWG